MAIPHSATFLLDLPACSKALGNLTPTGQPSWGARTWHQTLHLCAHLGPPAKLVSVWFPLATCKLTRSVSPGTRPSRGREGQRASDKAGEASNKMSRLQAKQLRQRDDGILKGEKAIPCVHSQSSVSSSTTGRLHLLRWHFLLSHSLETWFPTLLPVQPFNPAPHDVVTPNCEIIFIAAL